MYLRYIRRTVGTRSWGIVAPAGLFPKFGDRVKIASDCCCRFLLALDVGKVGQELISNEGTAGSYILVCVEVLVVGGTSNLYLHMDVIIYSHGVALFEWFVFPDNMLLFEYGNNRRGQQGYVQHSVDSVRRVGLR